MNEQLDAIDWQIIGLLMIDGRIPVAKIARQVSGISERAINNRIERLLLREVIRIGLVLDPRSIGFPVGADLLLSISPGHVNAAVDRLVELENISYVGCTLGSHDLTTTVIARDTDDLYAFMNGSIASVPHVQSTKLILTPLTVKHDFQWQPLDIELPIDLSARRSPFGRGAEPPFRIDHVDLVILNSLLEDGRMPAAEIARRIGGISSRSVRTRMERLFEQGVAIVAALLNPKVLGFPILMEVYLETEPGRATDIAQQLAQMRETIYIVCRLTGIDITVQVVARDIPQAYEFVTEVIHSIPGITKTESLVIPKLVKDLFDWRIPDYIVDDG